MNDTPRTDAEIQRIHDDQIDAEFCRDEATAFLDAAITEQIEQARKWKEHYATDPKGQSDKAFWDGKERALTECLHLIQSTTDRLTAQVEALRRDGERLDWLDSPDGSIQPVMYYLRTQGQKGTVVTYRQALDAAIDSAQRQEAK